jgi:hypothetical protein
MVEEKIEKPQHEDKVFFEQKITLLYPQRVGMGKVIELFKTEFDVKTINETYDSITIILFPKKND